MSRVSRGWNYFMDTEMEVRCRCHSESLFTCRYCVNANRTELKNKESSIICYVSRKRNGRHEENITSYEFCSTKTSQSDLEIFQNRLMGTCVTVQNSGI